jgi:asparagine synthase (glutamine-hydrolysing)
MLTALNRAAGGRWSIAAGEGAQLRVADRLAHDTAATLPEYYLNVMSFWKDRCHLVRGASEGPDPEDRLAGLYDAAAGDPLRWMMFRDSQSYLNDDILTKVDRAAMHYSLETRAPFLDHDLVRFAWGVPTDTHFLDGRGKWILRQALSRFVPEPLIERPKMGFAIPLGRWLRTDLRDWAEALLAPQRLLEEGWLDARQVRARWRYHLAGDDRYALALWSVLMFQAWLAQA